jgi:tetrahydromethanopterin S-methyltransferase subunit E
MNRKPAGPILRDMILPGLAGAIAGLVAVAGLLALDVAHLRALALGTPGGWVALPLLAAGFMVTFGSVAIGATIMFLAGEDG